MDATVEPSSATDPVCGMTVDPTRSPHSAEHGGRLYHFCSAGCRTKFVAAPERYAGNDGDAAPAHDHRRDDHHHHHHGGTPAAAPSPAAADGAVYTCPMHPEVRQIGPGACPICGMALEPVAVSAELEANPELVDMTRRLAIGLVFAVPLIVLDMAAHFGGLHRLIAPQALNWIELALAAPVVAWAGAPFFVRFWRSLVTRHLNMFTLIGLGTGVAAAYSTVATVLPGLFPPAFRGEDGAVAVYFEAAAAITVLVLVGQVLELRARAATSGALRALLDLAPKTALRVRDGLGDEDVPLEAIVAGDRLRVRPGGSVPVDGVVLEGRATVDEAMVTGEATPVVREAGGALIGGTLVVRGSVVMRAEKVGRDTMLARIVDLVAAAQRSRAPVQRLADQVAGWFVPAVVAVAVLAFAAWAAFGPEPRFAFALVAAVSVLIIACPCALGLATPMSIMVGIGRAARAGILVRDAEVLERLERADTLAIDKTGTLTEGRPRLVAVRRLGVIGEDDLLRLAAAAERGSEHPLALAVTAAASERGLGAPAVRDFDSLAGQGITAAVDGRRVALGNAALMAALGIDGAAAGTDEAARLASDGATVVFVAVDGAVAGLLAIADPVRGSAAAAVRALAADGMRVVMLTGDSEAAANAVARRLGIAEVEAGLKPADKAAAVARLRAAGRRVAMAGDGINDAPALAAADVGIAMGGGADIALESAGVTLLHGDLAGILRARRLSRAAMRNIRQNLTFAFVYNALGVPIAAGVLYPAFGLLLSPVIAAAAMALSSVSVVANALRLQAAKLD
ncbi:MAG TPA: heavy metal translocating P-type ATPase [Hyphomicrobiales bacterium]|nr:heavy metal translocating P-type ATPase [Hyphomicrobiales bacterium]